MNRRSFVSMASAAALLPPWRQADGAAGPAEETAGEDSSAIRFSLDDIPFSRAGSYLTINPVADGGVKRLRLQTVRKTAATYRYQTGAWSHEIFEFEMVREGGVVEYEITASVDRLELRASGCEASIAFATPESLTLSVRGCALRLRSLRVFSWKFGQTTEVVRVFEAASGYFMTLTAGPQTEVALAITSEVYTLVISPTPADQRATATLLAAVEQEEPAFGSDETLPTLEAWMRLCPPDINPATASTTKTAWYLFWNLRVKPSGGYTRPTVLSSKRSLSDIWSWDNLFNALAIASADTELAWDQLRVILDHQLPSGVFPDVVNDAGPVYGFRKPPIWAWAVTQLLEHTPPSRRQAVVEEIYPKIVAFHRWWFRERDLLHDGVPFYLNGNDSGWDNSTVFLSGSPVQSPDLLALLCVDAEHLASIAEASGHHSDADGWKREADRLSALFHAHFVRDDRIVFHELTGSDLVERPSTSLLTRMCVFLGPRLAPRVRSCIVQELRDPRLFFAASGPASESLSSPLYDANGYWRGPVWGPSTLLLCDGLMRCGEARLAAQFAERYRATVARRADFRENYDSVTGEGRYDSGMTWAAASFLLLKPIANQLLPADRA